jgi:glycosyltransferase involved in cell wall biosynthesis
MIPTVSIGMPLYNGERWLRQTVGCLQQQSFGDFELIISDNASTDASLAIAEELARGDQRIRLLRQTVNVGANANYEAVLGAARADLFKWASCNDICANEFLEQCLAALRRQPDAVLAYPLTKFFSESLEQATSFAGDFELQSDDAIERLVGLLDHMRWNNAMNGIIRRSALRRALRMGNFRSADILLMAELALLGKYALVNQPLFFRRMSPEAATSIRGAAAAEKHLVPTAVKPQLWQRWLFQTRLLRIASRSAPAGLPWFRGIAVAVGNAFTMREYLLEDLRSALSRVSD